MNKPNPEFVCEQILELLLKDGFSYQVPYIEVEKAIWLIRGQHRQTVKQWFKVLTTLQYLNCTAPGIYEMNVVKIPNLVGLLRKYPKPIFKLLPSHKVQNNIGE